MAADTFQFKRGTTAAVNAYLPAIGEPVYDITLKKFRVGDGVTLGGVTSPLDDNLALTGIPTAPTAALNTNTLQIATTAFVLGQAGTTAPLVNGVAAAGTSFRYSRQDHVHPTDTSKADLASPALTGVPTAPTAAPGTNSTQLATTAFVEAARVILAAADALKAPLASPPLTGVPTAPTAAIGTNTTQIATMAAIQARILGTVSQSAGVPTGTIIETGGTLNTTGKYTKFADGTMIIFKSLALGTGSTSAAGSIFRGTLVAAGSFPVNFVTDLPIVSMSGTDSGGGGWPAMDAFPTLTTWGSYSTRNHVSSGTSGTIFLTAIGRWF